MDSFDGKAVGRFAAIESTMRRFTTDLLKTSAAGWFDLAASGCEEQDAARAPGPRSTRASRFTAGYRGRTRTRRRCHRHTRSRCLLDSRKQTR